MDPQTKQARSLRLFLILKSGPNPSLFGGLNLNIFIACTEALRFNFSRSVQVEIVNSLKPNAPVSVSFIEIKRTQKGIRDLIANAPDVYGSVVPAIE